MPGVVRTRVGYAGGTTLDPTYHEIGDHAETLEIQFDPTLTSYDELLEIFWRSHSPTRQPWKRQYMSAIFTHGDDQHDRALATRDAAAVKLGEIHTEIEPAGPFYLAEDYHQKYRLSRTGNLLIELQAMYPRIEDLVRSTAAARMNGFVAGHGQLEALRAEIDDYGLSPDARRVLLRTAEHNQRHRS